MRSCLHEISKSYEKLTYSEKKLADYISSYQSEVVKLPIAELAARTNIAASTIVLMAKKLGYDGFREMKLALAAELSNPLATDWSANSKFQPSKDMLSDVVEKNIEALRLVEQGIGRKALEDAAQLLCRARHIYLFGEGTSDVLAQEGYDLLIRSDLFCSYTRDWQSKVILSGQASSEDVALLISLTGLNSNIIYLADRFREQKCPTIGVCNYKNTAFSNGVDYLLAPFNELSLSHANNFTFRIPIISILETLYYQIAAIQKERHKEILAQNRKNTVRESILSDSSEEK